jgi:hypothetical protein
VNNASDPLAIVMEMTMVGGGLGWAGIHVCRGEQGVFIDGSNTRKKKKEDMIYERME